MKVCVNAAQAADGSGAAECRRLPNDSQFN